MRTPSLLVSSLLLAAAVSSASAANLGVAGDYNLFALGSASLYNSQTQGRIAAYTDLKLVNYGAGTALADDAAYPSTLVAGEHITGVNGSILHGGVSAGGNVTFTRIAMPAGQVNAGGRIVLNSCYTPGGVYHAPEIPFNFDKVRQSCLGTSARLGALGANGVLHNAGGVLTLTGTKPGLNVFRLSSAVLARTNVLDISAPPGATVVVNVDGRIDRLAALDMKLHGVDSAHVLLNFPKASALAIGRIDVEGSVLAPNADVSFSNGDIDGTLIGDNLRGNGFGRLNTFQGSLPAPTPEPGTLLTLLLGGAAVFGMIGRRRLARSA
ncbi:hypothetical protein CCAX7_18570 [Capsulimonas corticalis]|uniref:Uncharacterized protein n=1 Tax=Capsulimonas corticalis TaxID=2219043 RepID=A0A402D5I9_9BACT|nr:choice-of-anchor A family protein [Capsulimonas corticalis]BDI29806.1 hypothetical protein CCAX7_18570 [Capsulimonas corticalis]